MESYLLLKGASEYIVKACKDCIYWDTDEIVEMNAELEKNIYNEINLMAQDTLRTICLAYKKIEPNADKGESNPLGVYPIEESGFTLLAVTGIKDVLRDTVANSVAIC